MSTAILFVDDEEYLAEVGREMLEDYGYEVDISTDPVEALDRFKLSPDRYQLLISDYIMPGMKGDELARHIRGVRADLPVILCSGGQMELPDGDEVAKILLKPFDMDSLLDAVREVLGGNEG